MERGTDAAVTLGREDARRLAEVLEACLVLLEGSVISGPPDDRVIEVAAASVRHAVEDWAHFLRGELTRKW